ncbi:MAG: hypothetical protein KAY21_09930 [Limnohabitans sp.]|nr:hypothetical protein [Limnohabitans sp.]
MNLFADTQIIAALLTVVLTAAAAVAGYFLREWLTRSKPFVSVIQILGSSRRVSARVLVPEKAVKASKKSHLFDELSERSRLDDIFDSLSAAKEIEERAQEIISLIDALKVAVTKNEIALAQSILEELLHDEHFDKWICNLVGERTVQVPLFDMALPTLIECGEEGSARDGSFAIGFPGKTVHFGSGLNNFVLYKSSVKALVELVSRLEFGKLAQVFESIGRELTTELGLAKDMIPPLQEIVDKNSQWSFRLYVANLGHSPFLIQTEAQVEIKDQSGGRYTEPCSLIVLKQNGAKDMRRVRAISPLVTQSQSDITFDFVTTRTQADMTAGDTVRSVFKSGSAQCRLTFSIERPGHSRSAKVTSAWFSFADTRPSAG